MYYVYMVRCQDGSHYTGIAKYLCKRMKEHYYHLPGCAKYTRSHQVVALDGLWRAADRVSASRLEYFLKQLPKAEKLALLRAPDLLQERYGQDYESVSGLTLGDCLNGTDEK